VILCRGIARSCVQTCRRRESATLSAMTATDDPISKLAKDFLDAAWRRLKQERVVPLPWNLPYVEVGRDYFGPDISPLPEFVGLEAAIEAALPKYPANHPIGLRIFPASYIFSFLETFIARRTIYGEETFSLSGEAATESLSDLVSAVNAKSWTVACCRVVSDLTTSDGEPLDIFGLKIVPLGRDSFGRNIEALDVIGSVIPGGASAFGRVVPVVFAPPESVVTSEGTTDSDIYDLGRELTKRIERLLLLSRLLQAGTSESMFEVQGETVPVRRFKPDLIHFRGNGPGLMSPTGLIRRSVNLCVDDGPRLEGLWALMVAVDDERPGMVVTSFDGAMQKFRSSYHAHTTWEQVVDLSTAFEAALGGRKSTDLVLRLKTRSAALLCTDNDRAQSIFKDVGLLYDLRSVLVHGGEMKHKDLVKKVHAISTVPRDAPLGVAMGYVVDRLRDLVRRSLLARICLATGETPRWPLGSDAGVDASLADDATRFEWRSAWRYVLTSFDAAESAERAPEATDRIFGT
jgi:hypothetical protein